MGKIKRKWTAEERRQLAAGEIKGNFAGPDQSYPIAGGTTWPTHGGWLVRPPTRTQCDARSSA